MNKLRKISVSKMFVAQTTLTVRRNKRIPTPKGGKLCIFEGASTSKDALNHVLSYAPKKFSKLNVLIIHSLVILKEIWVINRPCLIACLEQRL